MVEDTKTIYLDEIQEETMGMISKNLTFLKDKFCVICGASFGVLTAVLSFLTWDEMGITSQWVRLAIMAAVVLVSALIALGWLILKRKNLLWEQGPRHIQAMYGDIFKIASNRKCEKNVVISVNTTFDTIVGDGIVSPETLHGQWINQLCSNGHTVEQLDQLIEKSLKELKDLEAVELSEQQKPKGKRRAYPQGTVAQVDVGNTHYFLVALSHFDENLNAQCGREDVLTVVNSLIDDLDKKAQGSPVYIPLLGTGMSGAGLEMEESLQIISDLLKLKRHKLRGPFNIVVYHKHRHQVSIFDL